MDVNQVLFVVAGYPVTYLTIGAAVVGTPPTLIGLYKAIEWWQTREERRLALLHKYIDKEECDISAKRRQVLSGIRLADQSHLDDKELDVGQEIDDAIRYLDSGRPHRAEARLVELLKKLQSNYRILERRVEHLKKHERSVNIFLAAVADRENKVGSGLEYISDALSSDSNDADALKYKGLLLLKDQKPDLAKMTFDRLLRTCGTASGRAEAYLGLNRAAELLAPNDFSEREKLLKNCEGNLNQLNPVDQDWWMQAELYAANAELFSSKGWEKYDPVSAVNLYDKSLRCLQKLEADSRVVKARQRELSALYYEVKHQVSDGTKG